jgi:hypothetical protein
MTFISITQYFNRLHIVLFILLIVPLLVFIALYFFRLGVAAPSATDYYAVILPAVVLDCLVSIIIFNKKIKSARNAQGLGTKLEKYFETTIVRYSLISSASLLLAVGFYLTQSDVFTALYLGGLGLAGFLWPTSRKVAEDLRLRGDEKELVYFKKDSF